MIVLDRFDIRPARPEEAAEAAEIERICFPPNEACSPEQIKKRISAAPDLFLVAEELSTGRLAGFLNGLSTNEERFRDAFFQNASLYQPDGNNIMLLGLDVLPEYRGLGLASAIMRCYLKREKGRGRKKAILTCLEDKVGMYRKMGYVDCGISDSSWGGQSWHEMYCIISE